MEASTTSEKRYRFSTLIGKSAIVRMQFLGGAVSLLLDSLVAFIKSPFFTNRAINSVLLKQLYFSGIEATRIILLLAMIIGAVIVSQVVGLVGSNNGSLTGKVLVWVVFRELAPLLAAILVIARSGTAIATELGSMKLNGEIDTLELLGIQPGRYLILPRIIGVMVTVVVLTIYFVVTAFASGFLFSSLAHHIPFSQFIQGVLSSIGPLEVTALGLKSLAFGLTIPIICCQAGISVGKSATEIPQAATRAVINSIFAVFLTDGLITFSATFISGRFV